MKKFCVDLEIAKELKEAGFLQDTIYVWYRCYSDGKLKWFHGIFDENDKVNKQISAPCSDEILKELPFEINGYVLEIIRYENGTIEADYIRYGLIDEITDYLIQSKELFYKAPNALARLWLYLKKEGYIK